MAGSGVFGALLAACAGSPKPGAQQPGLAPPSTTSSPSAAAEAPPPPAPRSEAAVPTGNCTVGELTVSATDQSAHDVCRANFHCPGARTVLVTCDGENDGTTTSLCECEERGKRASVSGTVPGEGPDSCLAAGDRCLVALGP
jgi:hypothetical protein